jgi:hypothetical protein
MVTFGCKQNAPHGAKKPFKVLIFALNLMPLRRSLGTRIMRKNYASLTKSLQLLGSIKEFDLK